MTSPNRRREIDVMKLMMSDYEVTSSQEESDRTVFFVKFHGPKTSPYEGGVWKVRVELPQAYPFKSPSIGFMSRIFHPNVDEASGSVCLDVINQTWSPMFDLINIFEVFLPQLLLYPNPADPLNGEAANLFVRNHQKFENRVKEYVEKYAKPENLPDKKADSDEDEADESLSDYDDEMSDGGDGDFFPGE